jgi:hypothetical protein
VKGRPVRLLVFIDHGPVAPYPRPTIRDAGEHDGDRLGPPAGRAAPPARPGLAPAVAAAPKPRPGPACDRQNHAFKSTRLRLDTE